MKKNAAAVALGKMRRGIKEKPSKAKRAAILENLSKARARWRTMKPTDRKRGGK